MRQVVIGRRERHIRPLLSSEKNTLPYTTGRGCAWGSSIWSHGPWRTQWGRAWTQDAGCQLALRWRSSWSLQDVGHARYIRKVDQRTKCRSWESAEGRRRRPQLTARDRRTAETTSLPLPRNPPALFGCKGNRTTKIGGTEKVIRHDASTMKNEKWPEVTGLCKQGAYWCEANLQSASLLEKGWPRLGPVGASAACSNVRPWLRLASIFRKPVNSRWLDQLVENQRTHTLESTKFCQRYF